MKHLERLEELNRSIVAMPAQSEEIIKQQTYEILDLIRQLLMDHYRCPTVGYVLKPDDQLSAGALDVCCSVNSYWRSGFLGKATGVNQSLEQFIRMCESGLFTYDQDQ